MTEESIGKLWQDNRTIFLHTLKTKYLYNISLVLTHITSELLKSGTVLH